MIRDALSWDLLPIWLAFGVYVGFVYLMWRAIGEPPGGSPPDEPSAPDGVWGPEDDRQLEELRRSGPR